jgi:hypothetical protein
MASGADALAGAKKALAKAKDFTKSVEGQEPSMFAPKPTTHPEYKYSQSHAARQDDAGLSGEAKSAAAGISAKQKNVGEYLKATGGGE